MKFTLILVALSVALTVLYSQGTQCICELGIYLKNVNGKCSGEFKHFDTPSLGLGCTPIFGDLDDSLELDACTAKGLNLTFYRDQDCSERLFEEYLPAGECHSVTADNHTFALETTCGETLKKRF